MFLGNLKYAILICVLGGVSAVLMILAMKNFEKKYCDLTFLGKIYRIICVIIIFLISMLVLFFIGKILIFIVKLFFC